MSTIGERIRTQRIALGLSADELAARLGKNRATIYRYESDEIENFPISVIGPLSDALQVSPCYLMGWETEKKPAAQKRDELSEIMEVFSELTPDNRAKLLELSRLYLASQSNSEGKR